MFCSGRVIFGYLRDIRKLCNRKLPIQAVAFCLWFAAMSALFVLLREFHPLTVVSKGCIHRYAVPGSDASCKSLLNYQALPEMHSIKIRA